MIKHQNTFNAWRPALFDGKFDWDFLLPAWMGTKVQPMDVDAQMTVCPCCGVGSIEAQDIDAKVERLGHRLLFETKNAGRSIDWGQRQTLSEEWKLKATIMFLNGKTSKEITGYSIFYEKKFIPGKKGEPAIPASPALIKADAFDVIYRCRCWFLWASGKSKQIPSRKEWDNQLWKWDYERAEKGNRWDDWCREEIQKRAGQ